MRPQYSQYDKIEFMAVFKKNQILLQSPQAFSTTTDT